MIETKKEKIQPRKIPNRFAILNLDYHNPHRYDNKYDFIPRTLENYYNLTEAFVFDHLPQSLVDKNYDNFFARKTEVIEFCYDIGSSAFTTAVSLIMRVQYPPTSCYWSPFLYKEDNNVSFYCFTNFILLDYFLLKDYLNCLNLIEFDEYSERPFLEGYEDLWPEDPNSTAFDIPALSNLEAAITFAYEIYNFVNHVFNSHFLTDHSCVDLTVKVFPKPDKRIDEWEKALKDTLERKLPKKDWYQWRIEKEHDRLSIKIADEYKQFLNNQKQQDKQDAEKTTQPTEAKDTLSVAHKKAYQQYVQAKSEDPSLETDKEVWNYLKEKPHEPGELCSFDTWARYNREVRNKLGQQKNKPRAGRTYGRTISSPNDLDRLSEITNQFPSTSLSDLSESD